MILRRPNPIEQPPPVQFPEDGFDHPFQDSYCDLGPRQGKEHPRTVSIDSSRATPGSLHLPLRSSSYGCALSPIISEKTTTGGRR